MYARVVHRWALPLAWVSMAAVLVLLATSGHRSGPAVLYSGPRYDPGAFSPFPQPYSPHNKLGMVQYMPMNSTGWWDAAAMSGTGGGDQGADEPAGDEAEISKMVEEETAPANATEAETSAANTTAAADSSAGAGATVTAAAANSTDTAATDTVASGNSTDTAAAESASGGNVTAAARGHTVMLSQGWLRRAHWAHVLHRKAMKDSW